MDALRLRFAVWAVATSAIAVAYGIAVLPNLRVQTDLLAMLPAVERDPLAEDAVRSLSDASGRQLLFLVGAPEWAATRAAARRVADALRDSAVFWSVTLRHSGAAPGHDAPYAPRRALLLSTADRARLRDGTAATWAVEALRGLHSPLPRPSTQPFLDDPLGLHGRFLADRHPPLGALRPAGDVLATGHAGRQWVLVTASIAFSPFAFGEHDRAARAIASAEDAAGDGTEVLVSGVLRHAVEGSRRGQAEVATFGSVSLGSIIVLVLLTFRGLRPLLLTLASIGIGAVTALTACHFLFGELHLITLVFGSTLTGVAVDYSIHYFADQFRQQGAWDPRRTLVRVGPAVLVGMGATVIGYQALLLPPFPGLRQMAVFSIVGVAAACATVLMAYPLLANRRVAPHRPLVLRLSERLAAWRRPARTSNAVRALAGLAVALLLLSLWRVETADDVRMLQSPTPALEAEVAQVRAVLATQQDSRFLLLRGPDAESVLRTEEAVREDLDALVAGGRLGGYRAVTQSLPSVHRQETDHARLRAVAYAQDGPLARVLSGAGFEARRVEAELARWRAPAEPLRPPEWLDSEAADPWRALWLAAVARPHGEGHAQAITLHGIGDAAALADLAARYPGASFVDRLSRVNQVMKRYRQLATACLGGAWLLIAVALMLRYGRDVGLQLLVAPVGGALLTLAALGAVGEPVNLFNLLALLLVLGLGVDYAVFMREGRDGRATVIMAILLAGAMTLLSFGMLSFSSTPFIRSLGLTVFFGVSFTFVLALLASTPRATSA